MKHKSKKLIRYCFPNKIEWFFDGDSFQIKNAIDARGIYLSGSQEFGRLIDLLRYMNDMNRRYVRCGRLKAFRR